MINLVTILNKKIKTKIRIKMIINNNKLIIIIYL